MDCDSLYIAANKALTIWRVFIMAKNTMSIIKGVATGLAVGVAVGYVGNMAQSNKKETKKLAKKAATTITGMMSNFVKG